MIWIMLQTQSHRLEGRGGVLTILKVLVYKMPEVIRFPPRPHSGPPVHFHPEICLAVGVLNVMMKLRNTMSSKNSTKRMVLMLKWWKSKRLQIWLSLHNYFPDSIIRYASYFTVLHVQASEGDVRT